MGEKTEINWCDSTFNPWEGCQKVGPGCTNCYAETRNARYGGGIAPNWGPGAPRRRTSASNWAKPRKWARDAERFHAEHGRRQRVFCASLADVFDNEVDPQWRADLFDLIDATPELDWLLLTKRVGNVITMLHEISRERLPDHVWLGATIVNREEMLRDGPKLRAVPARVHFWSNEPLLGDLGEIPRELLPEWVIAGGESGPGARPMHPRWVRSLGAQCEAAGVPWLLKQWGEWGPDTGPIDKGPPYRDPVMEGAGPAAVLVDGAWQEYEDGYAVPLELCSGHGELVYRLGKKRNGRQLDGRTHDGFPR